MKRNAGKKKPRRGAGKGKAVPAEIAAIFPASAREGDRIVIRFARPLPRPVVPKVLIGERPLQAAIMRDASTLIGLVPADKAGPKKVIVGTGRSGKAGAFRHLGSRQRPRTDRPWRRISHWLLKDGGSVASDFAGGKAADPTRPGSNWWTAGAGLYRDANGHYAVSPTYTQAWQFTEPGDDTWGITEPVLSDDTMIVAPETFSGEGEVLVAMDSVTGARRWTWDVTSGAGRVDSTPLCVNGRVYVPKLVTRVNALSSLHLICADTVNGSILWDRTLGVPDWHSLMSLSAAYGMIYALTFDGSLRAYDATNGDLVWEQLGVVPLSPFHFCDQSTIVAYDRLFVGSLNGLLAFSPETGMPVDAPPLAFNCSASPILATTGTNPPLVIAGDDAGVLHAFNPVTGQHRWQFWGEPGPQYYWPRMACDLQRLYVQQRRTVVALDLLTGARVATSPVLGDGTGGAPIVCANRVFQMASTYSEPGNGRLYALDPQTLAIIDRVPLNGSSLSTRPVMDASRLYLNESSDAQHWMMSNAIRALRIGG
jgi:outer membrane protein assembly factor BamB